jgi:hypothetical protein
MSKNKKRPKKVKQAHQPSIGKRAKHAAEPSGMELTPVWSVKFFDLGGPWGKEKFAPSDLELIFPKLKSYESMTWKEIKANPTRDHSVSIDKLIKAARSRLEDIGLDDSDDLFRLRLTGTARLWGILVSNCFHLLWWDPHHEICPSHLKHT